MFIQNGEPLTPAFAIDAGKLAPDGRTITIAGATLQQRVEAAVAKAGGALMSSQVELDGPDAKEP